MNRIIKYNGKTIKEMTLSELKYYKKYNQGELYENRDNNGYTQ